MRTTQHLTRTGFLLVLPMFLLLGSVSTATAEQSGDFTYEINSPDTNTVTITGYTGAGDDVVIPSNIVHVVERSVTVIGDDAFRDNAALTSVIIPDSVTSIGTAAFYHCDTLTNVTIGSSVTNIGERAFETCWALPSVTIPDSVTSIGDRAFSFCIGLTSVTIADSVITIGHSAFYWCTALTSVTIPDSVTSIGKMAFRVCNSLPGIAIPDSVTSIGEGAFSSCDHLMSITVEPGNPAYCDLNGVLYNLGRTILLAYPSGRSGSYSVPTSVTVIGEQAFGGCDGLTSVTIADSVITIGHSAFSGCEVLTSVTIPDSVTSIGNSAFEGCFDLTNVIIPDSVTSIGELAFAYCWNVTSVTIGTSVTNIGNNAFEGCDALTSVYFVGDAPGLGTDVFSRFSSPTIYYLAGTTGWGPTFGGHPTALWTQPPEVLSQPQDTSVNVGDTAQFSVVAGSPFVMNYQWYVNGAPIPDGTNAALELLNVQLADAGVYAVVISDPVGSVTSSNALLWVNGADIKANDRDGMVVLRQGQPLTVTARLVTDPTLVGDTWMLATTSETFPLNIFSYHLDWNSWVPWLFTLYSPSAEGAIPQLESEILFESSGLPGGIYIFYLGYDPVQNRRIDFDSLEIDAVTVIIVD